MKFDLFRRYYRIYIKALENAIKNGNIGDDLQFDEGMLQSVTTELKKIRPHGYIKLSRPKVLKKGIKDALRTVSYLKRYSVFSITIYNFRLQKEGQS